MNVRVDRHASEGEFPLSERPGESMYLRSPAYEQPLVAPQTVHA
jgi:hypothetical protein